ncbi:replication protein A 70 kDa DNA-binding subunit D-like [Canna indica]|uniref:Replication protein A 70 kDa DNA-binding subunit D-like n=1 Tax=Canna indica TaxID=4628 RepID=A0AAQ3K1N0_9LILI|nr:replication protein A 70 kDa DNA-binding subunit D-like [Canna indica]
MEYIFINKISCEKEDWTIKIRVVRMWEAINFKNNDLISLDMIFVDEKENDIHAIIRKMQLAKFRLLLTEGSVYTFKNFKVVNTTGQYCPTVNDLKIIFLINTIIKFEDEVCNILKFKFHIANLDTIRKRTDDPTTLTDIVNDHIEGIQQNDTKVDPNFQNINTPTKQENKKLKMKIGLANESQQQVEEKSQDEVYVTKNLEKSLGKRKITMIYENEENKDDDI